MNRFSLLVLLFPWLDFNLFGLIFYFFKMDLELPSFVSNNPNGEIQLIFGPMFSGKTTELFRRVRRYRLARYKCVIVKYAKDTRYSKNAATHDGNEDEAIAAVALNDVVREKGCNFDVCGIDEGQFFPDIVDFAEKMAKRGKIVIIPALDGTYKREGFNDILNLVPKAEDIKKLKAVCMVCCSDASFTKRTSQSQQLELIGGTESYQAVCRRCYETETPKAVTPNPSPFKVPKTPNSSPRKSSGNDKERDLERLTHVVRRLSSEALCPEML